jgi:hypothetical protein
MKLDDRKLWRVRHTFTLKASARPEKGRLLTDRDHVDDRASRYGLVIGEVVE